MVRTMNTLRTIAYFPMEIALVNKFDFNPTSVLRTSNRSDPLPF